MKATNQVIKKETANQKIVDGVMELLKKDMHLVSTGNAPCDRALTVEESREYKLAGDITTLLPIAQNECGDLEELSSELWRLLRTIEDKRIITQTCLQILLGNADDEMWLQKAIEEIEGITNERINIEVDELSNKLLSILKGEGA